MTNSPDRGSATVWILVGCLLVAVVGGAAVVRTEAVLARHRAEAGADLAAVAAAGRIGVDADPCATARRVAEANAARVTRCVTRLEANGRSGTVVVAVRLDVRLPVVGERHVDATARAGRLRPGQQARAAPSGRLRSTRSSRVTAPRLSSGSLPLPHLGD